MTTNWDAEPVVLTVEDVARIAGCSVDALYRRVRSRKFPPPVSERPAQWGKAQLMAFYAGQWSVRKPMRKSA